ncbi:hypothetical protein OG352_18030 [Streptomyces sp. NBC_01485]|uniref:hypothetical protein n=1 Tax=Streptomyces sp. NBC_01485 TaxID=2903884 RepID=UPI002E30E321|nr:hypothetical protein [Streptomyces sp. NBC_01485]
MSPRPQLAQHRGLFKGRPGDIGADTTPVPARHHPPSERRDQASVEVTAGWHYCGGAEEGVFGHSATLLVAASRRHPYGHRTERHHAGRQHHDRPFPPGSAADLTNT